MKRTVFMAGLFHETHSFLDAITAPEDFVRAGAGEDKDLSVPGSPMAAAVDWMASAGWATIAGPYHYAMPGGTVARDVFPAWREVFAVAWDSAKDEADAIFLVLHGAMVAEDDTDVEASVVTWIRSLEGAAEVPIYAVMDLHGNISSRFADSMNGFLAYRENPHRDACEAARRECAMIDAADAASAETKVFRAGTDIVWPPSGTGTDRPPMRDLEDAARRLEARPGVYGINVFAGYAYGDTPDTGVSFSVVADRSVPEATAGSILEELTDLARERRAAGIVEADDPRDLHGLLHAGQSGPVLVAEPSDNIGAGAPGDGTGLLRLFLEEGIEGAGVIVNDPESVRALQGRTPESEVELAVGGKGSRLDAGPLQTTARLIRLFDGAFVLEDPQSHLASLSGSEVDMGDCALVQSGGVTILLTSRKTPPFDLGQWRCASVDPERFRVIGVKAAVAYRQAYDPIAAAHLTFDTPGPCPLDLRQLPFREIRRPVFPLDSE